MPVKIIQYIIPLFAACPKAESIQDGRQSGRRCVPSLRGESRDRATVVGKGNGIVLRHFPTTRDRKNPVPSKPTLDLH